MRVIKQQKEFPIWGILITLGIWFSAIGTGFAQLACEGTIPANFTKPWVRPADNWDGYVFQISPDYQPKNDWNRDFQGLSGANRKYKGYLLRDGNHYLSTSGLAFDTRFSEYSVDGFSKDADFFPTGTSQTVAGGCDTQLSNFGVILRSKKTIGEPGIYRVRVGSDDGSFFRMFENGKTSDITEDVNGDPVAHDNWFKDGSDGLYDFVYGENIRNYYIPFDGGEIIWMDLHYYEKTGNNRLSFSFELYFGPGEIANPGNAGGVRSYCGIAPDPEPFESLGPAVFAEGTLPEYQWQYTTQPNPAEGDWIDISGATDLTYDVPQYDESNPDSNWTGTRYFRRKAQNTAVDGEGNTLVNTFASNILEVNISIIEDLDQSEYGVDKWIGHIYSGIKNFDAGDYLGRMVEQDIFVQNFDYNGLAPVTFTPDYGCPFLTDRFSIRYKMRLSVEPGTLRFSVKADDGFRLSVDGGVTWLLSGQWESGGSTAKTYTAQYEVIAGIESLDLVMEYYEATGGNTIDFNYDLESLVLPLQWGDFSGQACGERNCLNWTTVQEKNTSHFVIEKSLNGHEWEALPITVPARGQSKSLLAYQAEDGSVADKQVFYRLRQVDRDGTFVYSDVIRVENHFLKKKPLPFPNPTMDFIHFDSEAKILRVRLSSQDQRINTTAKIEQIGEGRYRIDMRDYPSAHYLLILETDKERIAHKIMKR
ncbi:hypothetical protein [Cyclobacterium sp.]|uniref:hypothetical protein n=1 Tax=Cyclobacterium sp. TaxID=1966343 RepID=UPI0019C9CF9A|nr:hypothetical protein [Cyclobacterium sp.]MBD3626832.1 hypothetical protein [Cyclobacterium sp.]